MTATAYLRRFVVVMALPVAMAASAHAVVDRPEAALADVVLLDQDGREDSLAAHRGHPVLALVVQARRLRQLEGWERAIRDDLEDPDRVRFLRVADIRPGRGTTRERVIGKLAGRVPADVSILIDMEGHWREALGLDTAAPNLLLFDVSGRLAHQFRGRVNSTSVKLLVERLAALSGGSSEAAP